MIAIGSVLLSFAWVVKTLLALGDMPTAYVERYFTWIQSGDFRVGFDLSIDRLTAVMLLVVTGVGSLIHIYADRLHGARRRLLPLLRLLEPVHVLHADPGAGGQLSAAVRGMGRRGAVQLPADRLLLPEAQRHHGGQQGVHRESHRRLRLLAGDFSDLHSIWLARLRNRAAGRGFQARRRAHHDWPAAAGGRLRKVGAVSAVRLAAGCDGRPDAGLRVDSRRDHGDRGRVHGGAIVRDLCARAPRSRDGGVHRPVHGGVSPPPSAWRRTTSRKFSRIPPCPSSATCFWAWAVARFPPASSIW